MEQALMNGPDLSGNKHSALEPSENYQPTYQSSDNVIHFDDSNSKNL